MTLGRSDSIRVPLPAARTINARSAIFVSPRSACQRGATYGHQGMFSKTPPRRGSPPEVPPALHRKSGAEPARRSPGSFARRTMSRDPLLAEAVVALVTGSALLLAVATAAVMIRDSRSGPSDVPAPAVAEAPAPPPTAPPVAPLAIEPRFPAEPEEQPSVPEETKAQREQSPFPAPVAPSVDLLGPAPVDMRFAIYLASFSSEEQAHAGWEILERRYRRPLSGLSPLVRR